MNGWLATQLQRAQKIAHLLISGNGGELVYSFRNRLKKIDLEYASVDELGLSSTTSHWYSDSGGPDLARVFKKLRIPRDSVALDLGCGKGGAIFSMSIFPFAKLTGVDISPRLIDIARTNASRLGIGNAHFVQSDAATFTELSDVTHIYMYNPFPCAVFADVMKNLAESLASAPRDLVVVYKNPVCCEQIDATGLFEKILELKLGVHWWYVYKHAR